MVNIYWHASRLISIGNNMGCRRAAQGDAGVQKKVDDVPVGDVDAVMNGDVQVACTECGGWFSLQEAGLAGLRKSVIDDMEVFCMRCMHVQHSRMKTQLTECEQRMKWMEEVIRDLVKASKSDSDEPGSKRSPVKRRGGRKKMRLQELESNELTAESVNDTQMHSYAEVLSHQTLETSDSNEGSDSRQDEDASDRGTEETPFHVVTRRRMTKKNIKIIGDSMVKNITRVVKCDKEGSGCFSKRGAGFKEIVMKAKEECVNAAEGSLIVIQGGGNSLKHIGVEDTVTSVISCIQDIRKVRKDLNIAVTSILPRPCESHQYES